jgi:hypothetical protein
MPNPQLMPADRRFKLDFPRKQAELSEERNAYWSQIDGSVDW